MILSYNHIDLNYTEYKLRLLLGDQLDGIANSLSEKYTNMWLHLTFYLVKYVKKAQNMTFTNLEDLISCYSTIRFVQINICQFMFLYLR